MDKELLFDKKYIINEKNASLVKAELYDEMCRTSFYFDVDVWSMDGDKACYRQVTGDTFVSIYDVVDDVIVNDTKKYVYFNYFKKMCPLGKLYYKKVRIMGDWKVDLHAFFLKDGTPIVAFVIDDCQSYPHPDEMEEEVRNVLLGEKQA